MTTTVLASFPSPGQGVWYLGPIPIRAYALCIIAGIIAALVIGDRRWVARGGERGVVYDVALWAVPFGLVGGRLYHLLTDWKTYFGPGGAGIGAAARIWEGGLGIWGAVAMGGVGAWIACRRRGIPLPAFGDAVAPGIVLAQGIGRLGNYFNQELYGRETTVPWGMDIFYRRDSSGVVDVHSLDGVSTGEVAATVHPTFLYELLWNLLVFFFLLWADRKFRLGHGRLFALYVASYCVGRFWVELMRDDTATLIAGIRINVFTATFVFIGAVVYMLLAPKGRENPASLQGRQPVEARHESMVEEWAEDLVVAAKGSGIVAAATVAGAHETEDAEAVGDVADEAAEADEEETESVELVGEAELADADADEKSAVTVEVDTDEETTQAEHDVEVAEADVSEAEGDDAEAEGDDAEAEEIADEADADQETVVVYEQAATETDTVVVYESNESNVDEAVSTEAIVDEAIVDVAAVDEVVTAAADEDAVVGEEPDVDDEAVSDQAVSDEAVKDEAVVEAPESVAVAVEETKPEETKPEEIKPEVADEVEKTPESKAPEKAPEPAPEKAADTPDTSDTDADDTDQPKLGSTFKRLLWGAGNRGRS